MIQTVNGPIKPEELGITICHEHLALNLSGVRRSDDSNFDDTDLIADEVLKAKAYGVQSIIEVTCCDMGRDGKLLQEYGRRCDIRIVAATGYYLKPYYTGWMEESPVKALTEQFYRDIPSGIDGTNCKAGIIDEAATSEPDVAPSEEKVLIVATMARKRVGYTVTTHCQMGELALKQSALFQRHGVNPDKIIFKYLNLANDRRYYEGVLRTGVNIGFDAVGKTPYPSDEAKADDLVWLIEQEYEDKIMLSQDISRKSYLSTAGRYSGYMTVMKDLIPVPKTRELTEETRRKLLVENPARIFDGP